MQQIDGGELGIFTFENQEDLNYFAKSLGWQEKIQVGTKQVELEPTKYIDEETGKEKETKNFDIVPIMEDNPVTAKTYIISAVKKLILKMTSDCLLKKFDEEMEKLRKSKEEEINSKINSSVE